VEALAVKNLMGVLDAIPVAWFSSFCMAAKVRIFINYLTWKTLQMKSEQNVKGCVI
jgi:hypothetical protein